MWRYCGASVFILIGLLELVLAINKRVRDELMKNSPIQLTRSLSVTFLVAALSAFGIAAAILFFYR
jgi:hypothetical protein